MRVQAFFCLSLLAMASCAPTMANRGNLLDPEKLATIQKGVSTRNDVLNALGSPTAQGSFDDGTWYYIGRRTEQYAFFDPKVTEQKIVSIHFDDQGTVRDIGAIAEDKTADIAAAPGATPSFGQETSWIQDLFGNIGRAGLPAGRQK